MSPRRLALTPDQTALACGRRIDVPDLNGQMRKRPEPRYLGPVILLAPLLCGCHGDDRAKVAGT